MGSDLILILVVIAGFSFDFTNGFHDTANAMATSIATGALKPRVAVVLSACLNFAGAFISISVAATIAKGIVSPKVLVGGDGLELVLAALIGAMTWNLITWYFTIPSSSSHALIGGVIGATIAATASSGGWRIINTMGNRITNVESPQGFAAESSSAAVILASSYYGYPLSTTQVVSGGVLGSGLGKKIDSVHWNVIGQMLSAWVLTMPGAGVLGGLAWAIADIFGAHANVGALVIVALAAAGAFGLWTLAKRNDVRPDDLDRTNVSVVEEAEEAGVPAAVAAA